jgi:peptidoglycan/LPS O-acetylase OafA/YrhL
VSESTTSPRPGAPRLPYMPGVDGLRALAVAAVVIYHLGASWLPGGFLGVDVFLVISGYLITSLLLAEHRRTGGIELRRFWLRRARRLLPALFLMIVVVLAVMVLVHPGEVARLRGAVLASFAYVANWYFAFADVSYFEQFGRPSIFQHLWSLAVEEQFYLLWPPIIALGLVFLGRRWLLAGVLVLIAGSTALAWMLWQPFTDPSRIYYGTDTRAVGLLAGVALAFLFPATRLGPAKRPGARTVLDALGIVALGGLVFLMLTLGDLDEGLYRGGFLLVGLTTAVLIAVVAHPSSRLGRVFGVSAIVWLGVRSYGIYLWHWPVLMLTRGNQDVPFDGPPLVALQVALTVGVAALSYHYVERPFRRHGMRGVRVSVRRWSRSAPRPARFAAVLTASAAVAALAVAVAVLPGETPSIPGLTGIASAARGVAITATPEAREGADLPDERTAAATKRVGKVLAVGDSVMLGASATLRKALPPGSVVDASVGRQFPEGAMAVTKRLAGMKPQVVVLHLGNNGFVPFDGLQALMKRLRGTPRVVLVTVRVPLKWQDSVNDAIEYAADHHPNAVLADWHAVSGGSGLLVDGVHTTPAGARLYARTIARAAGIPPRTAAAASAAKPPRVTVIGDSVQASFGYVPQAVRRLGKGLALRMNAKVCRRLVAPSCPYGGVTPATALQVAKSLGDRVGRVAVINVGYNDDPRGYDVSAVMRRLRADGAEAVVWVTMRETRSIYATTNDEIRAAARRWPAMRIADWNAVSAGRPWFGSGGLHLNAKGALALAGLLRVNVLAALKG